MKPEACATEHFQRIFRNTIEEQELNENYDYMGSILLSKHNYGILLALDWDTVRPYYISLDSGRPKFYDLNDILVNNYSTHKEYPTPNSRLELLELELTKLLEILKPHLKNLLSEPHKNLLRRIKEIELPGTRTQNWVNCRMSDHKKD